MTDLCHQGRTAVVTGGASGIGWATSTELHDHGWNVVVADLNGDAARPRADDMHAMHVIDMDVTSESSIHAALDDTIERFGTVDALVNSAGIHNRGSIVDMTFEEWARVLDVNLHGIWRCLHVVGRHLIASGHGGAVVNISSIAGARGVAERSSYAAAKAAVESLTRTAALEWAPFGVRVNAVAPGFVDTELLRQLTARGDIDLDPVLLRTPMRRMARPEEIARSIRFLVSDDASYVTGHVLYVDGGFIADYGVPPGPVTTPALIRDQP